MSDPVARYLERYKPVTKPVEKADDPVARYLKKYPSADFSDVTGGGSSSGKESHGIRAGVEIVGTVARHPIDAGVGMGKGIARDYRAATNSKIIGGYESDIIGYDAVGDPIRKPMSKASIVTKDTPGSQTLGEYAKGARNTALNAAFAVAPTTGILARTALNTTAGAIMDDEDRLRGATAGLLLGEGIHQGMKIPGKIGNVTDVSGGMLDSGIEGLKQVGQEQHLWKDGRDIVQKVGNETQITRSGRRPVYTLPANKQPPVEPAPDAATFSTKGAAVRRPAAELERIATDIGPETARLAAASEPKTPEPPTHFESIDVGGKKIGDLSQEERTAVKQRLNEKRRAVEQAINEPALANSVVVNRNVLEAINRDAERLRSTAVTPPSDIPAPVAPAQPKPPLAPDGTLDVGSKRGFTEMMQEPREALKDHAWGRIRAGTVRDWIPAHQESAFADVLDVPVHVEPIHSKIGGGYTIIPMGKNKPPLRLITLNADATPEVLYHEVLHAMRDVKGRDMSVPTPEQYDNAQTEVSARKGAEYYTKQLAEQADPQPVSYPLESDIQPVASANGSFEARPGVVQKVNRELNQGPTATVTPRKPTPEEIAAGITPVAPTRGSRWAPGESLRDKNGALRKDLTNVPDEVLEAEITRIHEENAAEEAQHAAVQESGYRFDYEELPSSEKVGHKGKEDLPDADGNVDPERLLADNQTVADYNKRQVVRQARARAAARLEAELAARKPERYQRITDEAPPADEGDTSFDFGENVKPTDEPFQSGPTRSESDAPNARSNPREYLNYARANYDKTVEARVREAVDRGRDSGTIDKGYQSFEEQTAEARAYKDKVAKDLIEDPLAIDKKKLDRLTGAQVEGLKLLVGENTATMEAASRVLNDPHATAAELADASDLFDKASSTTDHALAKIVSETAQTARSLGYMRNTAKHSLDPEVWLVQAQRTAKGPISDAVKIEIRRLAKEAADICGGG